MKNRFLNGVSFLPLYAPEKGAGEGGQAELELGNETGDIAEQLEAAADDDQNDLNHSGDDEGAEEVKAGDDGKETEKAEGEEEAEGETEDEKAELEQLRKANKALGKRISALSKDKRELNDRLRATIKPVPDEDPAADGDDGEAPQRSDFKTKAEFEAAVEAAAERRAAQLEATREFNKACNAVEAAGSKAFGDKWAKAKAELAMLDDHGRIPMDILSVALETDNPARVLFVLGNDIEKATELMGMTPIKRAIAMDKIASSKPVAPSASKAPPPVEPIGGRGAREDRPSDRDSDEEWNRKEEARERRLAEERRKRGY
jgi:hypothetical protein